MTRLIPIISIFAACILMGCGAMREAPEAPEAPEARIVAVQARYTKCPVPQRPAMRRLDEREHVAGPANLDRIMANFAKLKAYALACEAALACYEAQAEVSE